MENTLKSVLIDKRPVQERHKDYRHEELAFSSLTQVDYTTRAKALKIAEKYNKENQKATGSCVAHSSALCGGILEEIEGKPYIRLAPAYIYALRQNHPAMGMYVVDAGNILRKRGCPPFEVLPTPATEAEINKIKVTPEFDKLAEPFKAGNFFTIYSKKIDDYANVTNNIGLPVLLNVFGTNAEWSKEVPEVIEPNLTFTDAKVQVQHAVVILPNSAYTHRGKKYVIVQDSAHFGGKKVRHLSEDWFANRVVMGLYWLTLPNPVEFTPQPFKFSLTLKYGDRGEEVRQMQNFLRSQGHFPNIETTGAFYGVTLDAVKKFQEAHRVRILSFFGLDKPTGIWGIKTREIANEIIAKQNM